MRAIFQELETYEKSQCQYPLCGEYLRMSVTAVSDLIKSGQAEIGFLAHFIVAEEPELKEEYRDTTNFTRRCKTNYLLLLVLSSLFVCAYL
jgi:hypothetical protein